MNPHTVQPSSYHTTIPALAEHVCHIHPLRRLHYTLSAHPITCTAHAHPSPAPAVLHRTLPPQHLQSCTSHITPAPAVLHRTPHPTPAPAVLHRTRPAYIGPAPHPSTQYPARYGVGGHSVQNVAINSSMIAVSRV